MRFELTHLIVPVNIHGVYFLFLSVLFLRVDIACLGSRIVIVAVLVLDFFAKMRSVSRLGSDLDRGEEQGNRKSALIIAAGYPPSQETTRGLEAIRYRLESFYLQLLNRSRILLD